MSVSATRYVWTVNLVGMAVIAAAIIHLVQTPVDIRWFILAVLALVSGATVLRLRFVAASFSVGDAFSFAALFLYGVEAATLTVALDALAITLRLKAPLSRTLFNVAEPSLAMWCAGTAVFRIAQLPLPVEAEGLGIAIAATAASVGIMYAGSSWLVAAAVALSSGQPIWHVWKQHFAPLWVNYVSCGYIGVLTAIGLHRFGLSVLTVIAPIPLILYFTIRATFGRVNDQLQHLTEMNRLHKSTDLVVAPGPRVGEHARFWLRHRDLQEAWGNSVIWGTDTSWGTALVWGNTNVVWDGAASWGQALVWGNSSLLSYSDGSALVWGNLNAETAGDVIWQSIPRSYGSHNTLALANPELRE